MLNALIFIFASMGFAQHQAMIPTQTFFSEEVYPSFQFGMDMVGGDSVGGGDSVDIRRSTAWFYGSDSIGVCYQLTANFGLNRSEVHSAITDVVSTWQKYFALKQIGSTIADSEKINTQFVLKEKCEGGEDLVLYFGTGPIFGNLEDLRARQALSRPVAYVNKTHIASNLKWSRGYIRFIEPGAYSVGVGTYFPNWSQGFSFYNMLLHEFGHVLGFEHVPDSIMDKTLSFDQFVAGNNKDKKSIDGIEELLTCTTCQSIYQAPNGDQLERIADGDWRLIQGGITKKMTVQHTVFGNNRIPLLTNFGSSTYLEKRPAVIFAEVDGIYYTMELANQDIDLRKNGELQMTFHKKETPQ